MPPPSSAVAPDNGQPFATQTQLPQSSPSYSSPGNHQHLSCPIAFYPDNIYGQGLQSGCVDRLDARLNDVYDGSNYDNLVRDPSVPLPPGVVIVQVFSTVTARIQLLALFTTACT